MSGSSGRCAPRLLAAQQDRERPRLRLEPVRAACDADIATDVVAQVGAVGPAPEYVLLRGLGRLHIFPGDDVGAHNKLRHLFGIDVPLDHQAVQRLVARWHPYAGVVFFHLLLDSLFRAGLVDQA